MGIRSLNSLKKVFALGIVTSSALVLSACEFTVPDDNNRGNEASRSSCLSSPQSVSGNYSALLSVGLGTNEAAQSINPRSQARIDGVSLLLQGVGSNTNILSGTVTLSLEGDLGRNPSGFPIATATLNINEISRANARFYRFNFNRSVDLAAGSQYWVRVRAAFSGSDSYLVRWVGTNQSGSFDVGQSKVFSGGAWTIDPAGSNYSLILDPSCD